MNPKLKSAYIIPIHSFVDLITNSSTEIYIQATTKTVESVKEIINNLLKVNGSSYTADDLFEISLFNSSLADRIEWDGEDANTEEGEYDNIELKVKAKDSDNELTSATAKLLSTLFSTLSIDARENY